MIELLAAIPFVHPTLAGAALATGAIPILIHLINRRRYRRTPWAAMSFLLAARQKSRRRLQFQQWLLMCLRVLVLVLLGLAIARPFLPASSLLPALRASQSHRIIVLDNSLSMSAASDRGPTRFESALQVANRLIAVFPESDRVSLVTVADPASAVLARGSADRRIIHERLTTITQTQAKGDPHAAVAEVRRILNDSQAPPGNRTIHWLSDFAGTDWIDQGNGSTPGAAVTAIRQLADALPTPQEALTLLWIDSKETGNVALSDLRIDASLTTVNSPIRLTAQIRNFSDKSLHDRTVQLLRDAQIVRRVTLPALEPGGQTTLSLSMEFEQARTHVIEARLVDSDALGADNARYLSLDIQPATRVLLIDGRPSRSPLEGAAGFVATALAPESSQDTVASALERTKSKHLFSTISTRTIASADLASTKLSQFDVVIMCNVQELTPRHWQALNSHVTDGGGLIVFGGDLVATEHYNRFGYADGKGVLPVKLNAPPRSQSGPYYFDQNHLGHAVVSDFAGHPDSGLFLARIDRYLQLEADPTRAETAMKYTNGDAAIVTARIGSGRVIVMGTSANMDWSNLPAKGDFVSLMVNAVAYGAPQHGLYRNVQVGQNVVEPLTSTESSSALRVAGPDGSPVASRIVPAGGALALDVGPCRAAGIATAHIGTGKRFIAVNVDNSESDTRTTPPEELLKTIDRPIRTLLASSAEIDVPQRATVNEISGFMLYGVAALLLLEMWVAMWVSDNRK